MQLAIYKNVHIAQLSYIHAVADLYVPISGTSWPPECSTWGSILLWKSLITSSVLCLVSSVALRVITNPKTANNFR